MTLESIEEERPETPLSEVRHRDRNIESIVPGRYHSPIEDERRRKRSSEKGERDRNPESIPQIGETALESIGDERREKRVRDLPDDRRVLERPLPDGDRDRHRIEGEMHREYLSDLHDRDGNPDSITQKDERTPKSIEDYPENPAPENHLRDRIPESVTQLGESIPESIEDERHRHHLSDLRHRDRGPESIVPEGGGDPSQIEDDGRRNRSSDNRERDPSPKSIQDESGEKHSSENRGRDPTPESLAPEADTDQSQMKDQQHRKHSSENRELDRNPESITPEADTDQSQIETKRHRKHSSENRELDPTPEPITPKAHTDHNHIENKQHRKHSSKNRELDPTPEPITPKADTNRTQIENKRHRKHSSKNRELDPTPEPITPKSDTNRSQIEGKQHRKHSSENSKLDLSPESIEGDDLRKGDSAERSSEGDSPHRKRPVTKSDSSQSGGEDTSPNASFSCPENSVYIDGDCVHVRLSVSSVFPANGPTTGGNFIRVKFFDTAFNPRRLYCRFGLDQVECQSRNGGTFECEVPPSPDVGDVELAFGFGDLRLQWTKTSAIYRYEEIPESNVFVLKTVLPLAAACASIISFFVFVRLFTKMKTSIGSKRSGH
jgi:hypothetical protein